MGDVHLKRRLTAVLLADVVGYSRLMSADEEGTHARLTEHVKTLIEPAITRYRGRPVRSMGDGLLIEFDSALDAVRCAIEIQRGLAEHEANQDDERIQLRIGINTGDVIADQHDIYGNSVNIAARLEGLAEPGQIYVTRGVRDQLLGCPIQFEDKGKRRVKNIGQPIRVYRVKDTTDSRLSHARTAVRGPPSIFGKALRSGPRTTLLSTAALATALTAGIPSTFWWDRVPATQPSILVLPFSNFSGDPSQDYLADAITDDLTTDLSRVPGTFVISSDTAFTYKGKAVDVRQIQRDCGVRYILEGSVEKLENKVKTNARLIEAGSGVQLWGDRFESNFTDLAELQDVIVGRIASSLQIQLVQVEDRRATAERTANPDATDLRLHAMALLASKISRDHHRAARDYLRRSLAIDENSAESLSELAHLLMNDYYSHWLEPNESLDDLRNEAADRVRKALEINPLLPLAHQADGLVHRARGEHEEALDAFDRALQLDPNFARAWAQRANELVMLGRPEEALPFAFKAMTLSPRDPALPVFYWIIGRAYFVMEDYKNAIIWLRKSVEMRGDAWYTRAYLIAAYALLPGPPKEDLAEDVSKFTTDFSTHTIKRIREVYEKENPQRNQQMKTAIDQLSKGLQSAGVPLG
jgi:adenylate cyclase